MPTTQISATSQSPSLYLFKAEDLSQQAPLDVEHKRQLKLCLKSLQTSLSASSKPQAISSLKTALAIAQQLESLAAEDLTVSPSRTTSWRLADQNNHLDIQTLQVNYPLQCLIVNLVSASQVLLDASNASNFTSQAMRLQRQGLLNCTQFLAEMLNLSKEVS